MTNKQGRYTTILLDVAVHRLICSGSGNSFRRCSVLFHPAKSEELDSPPSIAVDKAQPIPAHVEAFEARW